MVRRVTALRRRSGQNALALNLKDVEKAWQCKDSITAGLFIQLVQQYSLHEPADRSDQLNFGAFLTRIHAPDFKSKSAEEKKHFRQESLKALEAPGAQAPLNERLTSYNFLMRLWEDEDYFSRQCLLEIIRDCPLLYGPWKAFKRIFKEAEKRVDMQVYGVLAARIDEAMAAGNSEIGAATLVYLSRRAWRFLRHTGQSFGSGYADFAVQVLQAYSDNTRWDRCWIASHIFHHQSGDYGSRTFKHARKNDLIGERAFPKLWQRTPRPLLALLERARAEKVRQFACQALRSDFETSLREMEPAWVVQLVEVGSATIDEFIVWLLKNVPKFEQSALRELGLHEVALALFDSRCAAARQFAAEYARVYARDMPLADLIALLDNDSEEVQRFALDILREKDPRSDIGLPGFTRLLQTKHGYRFAVDTLMNQFSATELKPQWFAELLLSEVNPPRQFAMDNLLKIHTADTLRHGFFQDLIEGLMRRDTWGESWEIERQWTKLAKFTFRQLEQFNLNGLASEFVEKLFVWPLGREVIAQWIDDGKYQPGQLNMDFYREIAYRPYFRQSGRLQGIADQYGLRANQPRFDSDVADSVLAWLKDGSRFPARLVGFDWLMELVGSDDSTYTEFAADMLMERFTPADFAEHDGTDLIEQGCSHLWRMLLDSDRKQSSRASFAMRYLRRHHSAIGQKITGQKLADETTIPADFLGWDRCMPLFAESRKPLREFALELGHWEFVRWSPPAGDLLMLSESIYEDVREFVVNALFACADAEHKTFRLDTAGFAVRDVYAFCDSKNRKSREIGMQIIQQQSRLQQPPWLFRLCESADRRVRGFGIKHLWRRYRDKGIHAWWVDGERRDFHQPGDPPADSDQLRALLRKVLFEIPQARMAPSKQDASPLLPYRKPVSTRKNKLAWIETIRDLAVDDAEFAQYVKPLLQEFMASHGVSEQAACLVALTRIQHAHIELSS